KAGAAMVEHDIPRRSDGRHRRSLRTSDAIVDAYLVLAREKQAKPTAIELAARAGCSPRSIYERFGSLDVLVAATFDHVLQELAAWPPSLLLEGDRYARICSQVRARGYVCEEWLLIWQILRGDFASPTMHTRIRKMHQLTREQLELVYRRELSPLS